MQNPANRKLVVAAAASLAALTIAALPAAAAGAKGTRAHPYPLHTAVLLPKGKGWKLTVNRAIPDATRIVLKAPGAYSVQRGEQYFLINVTLVYTGKGSASIYSAYDLTAAARSGLVYTRLNDDCGGIPHPLPDFKKVPTGGRITGNICFSVVEKDARGLLLKCVPTKSQRAKVFFKL
jgi:hypothetical protein